MQKLRIIKSYIYNIAIKSRIFLVLQQRDTSLIFKWFILDWNYRLVVYNVFIIFSVINIIIL